MPRWMPEAALTCGALPAAYQGLWRRTMLETTEVRDVDSTVYWLQTECWHADLRVPAGRPDFSRVRSLEQCTPLHLEWLLRQEGFAGTTQVHGNLCEWHRRLDYHPGDGRDIGYMCFHEAFLEEFGVERQYREQWQQVPLACRQFSASHAQRNGTQQLLLCAGEYFMHVRPHQLAVHEADNLWSLVEAQHASLDDMRKLADFEISFGLRQKSAMRIVHSTLPWMEGGILPQIDDWLDLPGGNDD